MACILAAPTATTKGIVTFTTPERDNWIFKHPDVRSRVEALKERWVVGLHHNWHDFQFNYDALFDFSMAGEDDLREVAGRAVPMIPLDAANFVPDFFQPGGGEKYWDILYVARAVFFKKIPEFFQCVRQLYDAGHNYRILFLCPVPPYRRSDKRTTFYQIREVYDALFSEAEKDRFTLLTMDYRYPFPLDLPTLAHFYRSSKVFVHCADDERRPRVAAYAWASGLPVVSMSCVGSLLRGELKQSDYYFEVPEYGRFPALITEAIKAVDEGKLRGLEALQHELCARHTVATLERLLADHFAARGLDFAPEALAFQNLDIRIARHHDLGAGPNTVKTPFRDLLETLRTREELVRKLVAENADPERALERMMPAKVQSGSVLDLIWRTK